MKLIKIITLTTIATILTIQVAQAGSLLTGTSGSSGSLLNSGGNTTGGSLMNESYGGEVYDSSGNQMSCYVDSWGNTICE